MLGNQVTPSLKLIDRAPDAPLIPAEALANGLGGRITSTGFGIVEPEHQFGERHFRQDGIVRVFDDADDHPHLVEGLCQILDYVIFVRRLALCARPMQGVNAVILVFALAVDAPSVRGLRVFRAEWSAAAVCRFRKKPFPANERLKVGLRM